MSEEIKVTPQGYTENPDLLPVPIAQRRYGTWTWILMMFSMNVCIPMFFLGPIGKGLGLDLWQVLVGAFIGNFAVIIVMWLNGTVGSRHGITFPVQLREPFGFRGMNVPLTLRAIAGMVWYGIEVYVGSLALLMIFLVLIGIPTAEVMRLAILYLPIACAIYLTALVLVMRYGLRGIGRMATIGGPLMLFYFGWLVIWLATSAEFAPAIPDLFISTAGYFSAGFLLYLAVQTNWWATVALNISDLARGINPKKPYVLATGLFVGIVIAQIVGTGLGYAAVTLTGVILPQEIILKFAPGLLAVLIGLTFASLAPWSTDIVANAPPVISLLMSQAKLAWKRAVLVAAIIAFFAAPWWAFGAASMIVDYATAWAGNYGILLGPIAGIMIGSYWVTRKRKYDVQKLYTFGPAGCWYAKGWSKAAFTSLILTWLLCYLIAWPTGQITVFLGFPFPGGVIWYAAVLLSFILYLIFARVFKE